MPLRLPPNIYADSLHSFIIFPLDFHSRGLGAIAPVPLVTPLPLASLYTVTLKITNNFCLCRGRKRPLLFMPAGAHVYKQMNKLNINIESYLYHLQSRRQPCHRLHCIVCCVLVLHQLSACFPGTWQAFLLSFLKGCQSGELRLVLERCQ